MSHLMLFESSVSVLTIDIKERCGIFRQTVESSIEFLKQVKGFLSEREHY